MYDINITTIIIKALVLGIIGMLIGIAIRKNKEGKIK